jgi:hypothetical protein
MYHSIRTALATGDFEQQRNIKNDISFTILFLANTYTGANFKNPPSQENLLVMRACCNFIIDRFPQLSISELELAFSLAASGKFEGLNLETYFGKFTIVILGNILKAYDKARAKVIIENGKELGKQIKEQERKQMEQLNEQVKKDVIKKFNDLKALFLNEGIIPDSKDICAYWAKILINSGTIKFTEDERKQIWKESKQSTEKEIKTQLHGGTGGTATKQNLRAMLRAIADGQKSMDFNQKATANYSKLLIIKSIIQ